jgi:hypothetical protein
VVATDGSVPGGRYAPRHTVARADPHEGFPAFVEIYGYNGRSNQRGDFRRGNTYIVIADPVTPNTENILVVTPTSRDGVVKVLDTNASARAGQAVVHTMNVNGPQGVPPDGRVPPGLGTASGARVLLSLGVYVDRWSDREVTHLSAGHQRPDRVAADLIRSANGVAQRFGVDVRPVVVGSRQVQ